MNSPHILIVDDDREILDGLVKMLTQSGYQTSTALTGKEALSLLDPFPHLIILDLMLPDMDGYTLCHQIRQQTAYIPILMLTAREELNDKVLGLELGADDFVTKPFEPRELLSRIRALLRFAEQQHIVKSSNSEQPIIYGPVSLWRLKHRIEVNGEGLELTPIEWALLELLVQHPGVVFGRETLLRQVWNNDLFVDSRTVDTHMQRLRSKLERNPNTPRLIQTVRGFGFRLFYDENSPK